MSVAGGDWRTVKLQSHGMQQSAHVDRPVAVMLTSTLTRGPAGAAKPRRQGRRVQRVVGRRRTEAPTVTENIHMKDLQVSEPEHEIPHLPVSSLHWSLLSVGQRLRTLSTVEVSHSGQRAPGKDQFSDVDPWHQFPSRRKEDSSWRYLASLRHSDLVSSRRFPSIDLRSSSIHADDSRSMDLRSVSCGWGKIIGQARECSLLGERSLDIGS